MDTFIARSLDHAKLLTDPFKLQLLERFAGDPVTTKQVADRMGEKAPRLYRHVDALFNAGFLELVEEKPKRGTVERYYRTVAARFEVDHTLFSTSSETQDEGIEMMRSVIREVEADLVRALANVDETAQADAHIPILMKVALRGTDREIGRLRKKLEEWLEECAAIADSGEDTQGGMEYAGLLAFYPIQREHDA